MELIKNQEINNSTNKENYSRLSNRNILFLEEYSKTRDYMISLTENFEVELNTELNNSRENLFKLRNTLNIYSIEGINIRNKDLISSSWVIKTNKVEDLENIIFMWQRLAIEDPNNESVTNVVWWIDESWNPTYVYEWTKQKVEVYNWMKIIKYNESNTENENKHNEENNWYKPPVLSAPTYKNPRTWVTLCSKTARENLQKLWCKNPKRWRSAKESFDSYWKAAEKFPPENNNSSLVDLYMDASPRNRRYWHRAVGVKINWEWFVLDPYYNRTRNPVKAKDYISTMNRRYWRRIWWWFSLS